MQIKPQQSSLPAGNIEIRNEQRRTLWTLHPDGTSAYDPRDLYEIVAALLQIALGHHEIGRA